MIVARSSSATEAELRDRLERAATGLVCGNGADHPFKFFCQPRVEASEVTPSSFLDVLGMPASEPVDERSLDDFLAPFIERSDPADPRAREARPRYERLKHTLRETLRDVRVYRVGSEIVRCYIVGRAPRGALAGLATTGTES